MIASNWFTRAETEKIVNSLPKDPGALFFGKPKVSNPDAELVVPSRTPGGKEIKVKVSQIFGAIDSASTPDDVEKLLALSKFISNAKEPGFFSAGGLNKKDAETIMARIQFKIFEITGK